MLSKCPALSWKPAEPLHRGKTNDNLALHIGQLFSLLYHCMVKFTVRLRVDAKAQQHCKMAQETCEGSGTYHDVKQVTIAWFHHQTFCDSYPFSAWQLQ